VDERRLGPPDRRPLPTDASKAIELLYARHEQLVDGHAELNSRLDDQAEELRANTQATQQAGWKAFLLWLHS
jgi:prefoldin subunit 5